jgi:hypothetical protein
MIFKIIISVFVIIVLIVYCGQDSHDEIIVGPDEIIHISVSKGLYPIYSWDTGSANKLIVLDDSSVMVWGVFTPNANKLSSPIKHGEIPEDAELFFDREPVDSAVFDSSLINGKSYYVRVTKLGSNSIGAEVFVADTIE